jgi:hypothetical protein
MIQRLLFGGLTSHNSVTLLITIHFPSPQEWVRDLNDGSKSLSFTINGRSYPAHSLCLVTGKKKKRLVGTALKLSSPL